MYVDFPIEFAEDYDSIRVQMSPPKRETEDADVWEVSPVLIDEDKVR